MLHPCGIRIRSFHCKFSRTFKVGPSQQLSPLWLTGFVDGEGCFYVYVAKNNNKYKQGWKVHQRLTISLHNKDKALLEQIKIFLGVGKIFQQGLQAYRYEVSSVKDLKVIINHFDKFPLKTGKKSDYELWKKIFNIIKNKEHLTP